jgi:hypothetical protein
LRMQRTNSRRRLETQQAASRAKQVHSSATGEGSVPEGYAVRCSAAWAAAEGPLTSAVRSWNQLVDSPSPASWILYYSSGDGLLLARHGSCVAQIFRPQNHPQSRASLFACRAPQSAVQLGVSARRSLPQLRSSSESRIGIPPRGGRLSFLRVAASSGGSFVDENIHLWSHVVSAPSSRVISSA